MRGLISSCDETGDLIFLTPVLSSTSSAVDFQLLIFVTGIVWETLTTPSCSPSFPFPPVVLDKRNATTDGAADI